MSSSYATAVRRDSDSAPPTAQSWAPPKNPLPPHRLARLANALGVSTPMPAIHTPSPLLSPSYNGSLDQYRRSPTPSSASTFGFSASSSKYLLHVIPPLHLPHDSDGFDSELTPPPSTASGYHTQFRRGTLVPVHPTLQSQLGAIAREYALPSTAGLVLYLVSQQQPTEKSYGDELDEPGPRLSEDIWRHLWTRIVKTELRDEGMSLAPPLLGLGIPSRSTPYLTHEPLPLLSTSGLQPSPTYPFTPSPTTPSSTSDAPRFTTKSAPPSSSSRSPSEAETPDTSQEASSRAASLDLPGLGSGALIPILAKVEFDVDRRKAAWYEPWLRSRRLNHAKRAESIGRKGTADSSADEEERRARAPLALRLNGRKQSESPASFLSSTAGSRARYLPLSDSPHSMTDSDSEDADDTGKDPLGDVFGTDADTWADMRAERQHPRPQNPHVVQLALSAAELSGEPPDEDEGADETDDVRDVVELMGRPKIDTDIPGMHRSTSRRRAPPPTPLVLHPSGSSTSFSSAPQPAAAAPPPSDESLETPPDQEGRTILPYLDDTYDAKNRASAPRVKSMYDPDKRGGGIFDDMDLGFEVPEDDLDLDDPNDRRKSQFVMRAQLDEIEKHLAQFSPRKLKTDLAEEQTLSLAAAASAPHLSPLGSAQLPAISNADVFPPTPRLPNHPDIHEEEDSDSDDLSQQAAWPAVPFTSLADRPSPGGSIGPPQLAVNGVSAAMPRRFRSSSRASTASTESEMRRRDLAEQQAAYPAMTPSIGLKSSVNSPLIPLSPDPFGRHPSQLPESSEGSRQSASYWDAPVVIPAPPPEVTRKGSIASISETKSSRFSTDSMHGNDAPTAAAQKQANRTTLMSVKSIKKLWRKSNKNSVSAVNTNARAISTVPENVYSPLTPPPRPNRPSMEDMDLPDVDVPPPPRTPITGGFGNIGPPQQVRPPLPPSSRPSQDQLIPSARPSQDQMMPPSRPSQDQLIPPQDHSRGPSPMSVHARSQSQMSAHSQMSTHSQLSVPPPMLRPANNAPIVAAKAGPPRKPSLDGLLWDQESPYPTRAVRAPSISSSASRPNSRPPSVTNGNAPNPSPNPSPPNSNPNPPAFTNTAPPESHRNSVRKSILKWKSATANGANANAAVPAPLTPSATSFRTRKTSLTGSPSQGSPLNLPADIPPSPKIPEQFINSYVGSHPPAPRPNSAAIARRRLSAKMASTSTDASSSRRHSPHHRTRESMASSSHSHGSDETRETHESTSLDTSGFEIVSPKMGGTLSFPYHELDQDRPVDGVRM
ncbi:hypothetical protein FB451DRAFT_1501852 [Mycena latifolia]|nr:hypothetical protein FB451DRAFT_1501852 [Mycena latifolia]